METMIFCITLTSIVAILLIGIGVSIGRVDKGELHNDSDIRIYHPRRSGDDRRLDRITPEEMSVVLYSMRSGASKYEKDVIDRVIEMIEGGYDK